MFEVPRVTQDELDEIARERDAKRTKLHITQLTYSRSMKIQLVRFEQSADVGLFAQCQVDEGEDPIAALAALKAFVSDNLREDVAALMAVRKIG